MAESLRINILIDPDLFPDIYEDYMRLKKTKKRVDGSRILHLATIGLMMTRQSGIDAIPVLAKSPDIEPPATKVDVVKTPAVDVGEVQVIDDDEADALNNVFSGNFS